MLAIVFTIFELSKRKTAQTWFTLQRIGSSGSCLQLCDWHLNFNLSLDLPYSSSVNNKKKYDQNYVHAPFRCDN